LATRRLVSLHIFLSWLYIPEHGRALILLLLDLQFFRIQRWRLLIFLSKSSSCIVAGLPQPVMNNDLRDLLIRVSLLLLHLLLHSRHLVDHSSIVGKA
jgi:hypothetical protein